MRSRPVRGFLVRDGALPALARCLLFAFSRLFCLCLSRGAGSGRRDLGCIDLFRICLYYSCISVHWLSKETCLFFSFLLFHFLLLPLFYLPCSTSLGKTRQGTQGTWSTTGHVGRQQFERRLCTSQCVFFFGSGDPVSTSLEFHLVFVISVLDLCLQGIKTSSHPLRLTPAQIQLVQPSCRIPLSFPAQYIGFPCGTTGKRTNTTRDDHLMFYPTLFDFVLFFFASRPLGSKKQLVTPSSEQKSKQIQTNTPVCH